MQGFFTILIKSKFGNISWNFVFKLKVNLGDTDFNLKPNYRYQGTLVKSSVPFGTITFMI